MTSHENIKFFDDAGNDPDLEHAESIAADSDGDMNEDDIVLKLPLKLVLGPMHTPRAPWIEDQGWCIWLRDDPRSVTAMLRGKGDGREKLFEKFARYMRKRTPDITEVNLAHRYHEYARHMDRKIAAETRRAQKAASLAQPCSFLEWRVGIAFPMLEKRYVISLSTVIRVAAVSGVTFWLHQWLCL